MHQVSGFRASCDVIVSGFGISVGTDVRHKDYSCPASSPPRPSLPSRCSVPSPEPPSVRRRCRRSDDLMSPIGALLPDTNRRLNVRRSRSNLRPADGGADLWAHLAAGGRPAAVTQTDPAPPPQAERVRRGTSPSVENSAVRRAGRRGAVAVLVNAVWSVRRPLCRFGHTACSFENQSAIETNGRPSRPPRDSRQIGQFVGDRWPVGHLT